MTGGTGVAGSPVLDATGAEVGVARVVLVDPATGQARWLSAALSDGTRVLVPMDVASVDAAGRIALPFEEAVLRAAPAPRADVLSNREANDLLTHYGLST